jgi:hypothetical protein
MKNKESKFQRVVYMGKEGVNIYSEDNRVIDLLEGDFVPFIPEWRVEKHSGANLSNLVCHFGKKH